MAGWIFRTASSSSSTSCSRRCTIAPASRPTNCCGAMRARCAIRWSRSSRIRPTGWCPHNPGYDLDYDRLFEPPSRPAPSSKSTARRVISIWTARSRAARSPRARRSPSTPTPSRGGARPSDGAGDRHRAPRMGRAAPRAQHAAARRHPRRHRRETRLALTSWRSPPPSCVALAAFALYHATLLPGLDFGDTASLQTIAGSPLITPRDGYPLYFAIASVLAPVVGGDPAHALNLASALESARRVRAARPGRRGAVGLDPRRHGRRAAVCRVVHVLEPVGHRGGLRPPHAVCVALTLLAAAALGGAADADAPRASSSPSTRSASAITSR